MQTVPLSEAKDRLSALVDEVDTTREVIQITRHGHSAAVLMSADDLESLHETLYALSTPGTVDDLAAARRAYDVGETVSGDQLRRQYGLGPR